MRRMLILVLATVLGIVGLALAGCSQSAAASNAPVVNVRVGYNKTWSNIGFVVGIDKGMFDNIPGIKVSWMEFNDTVKEVEGMQAGDLDVGAVASPNLLTAVAKGIKIKGVALLSGATIPPVTYFVRKDSGINKVADLKGKKIAVTQYGGNFDLYLRWILAQNGLDPDKDVEILVMPGPAALNALVAGQIDSTSLGGYGAIQIQEKYGDRLKGLFTFNDVDPAIAKGFNSLILSMSDDFVKKNRDAAKAFLKAYVQAVRFSNSNVQQAKESWAKISRNNAVLKMTALPYVPDDAKLDIDALGFDIKVLKRFGYLKKDLNPMDTIDYSVLDEALAGK